MDSTALEDAEAPNTWYERKCAVEMLGSKEKDLFAELEFTALVLGDDAYNKYAWSRRQWVLEKFGSKEKDLYAELKFTFSVLTRDAYNKYAWSHRQWVLEKLGRGYVDELAFCTYILEYRSHTPNRLIWDQRCFAVMKCLAKGMRFLRSCEVYVAMFFILRHPEDENPWRYLRLLYKNDMKALARNTHLQWALISVFVEASKIAYAVRVDKVMYTHCKHAQLFDPVNKRGCLFALDLVSDLLKHEHQPDDEVKEAFDEVFQEYDSNTFAEKVDSVLQKHRLDIMELCADFTMMTNDVPGVMETDPAVVFEGFSPVNGSYFIADCGVVSKVRIPLTPHSTPTEPLTCSELYDKNELWSPDCFFPEDPNFLKEMRSGNPHGGRRIRREVIEDDHKDNYSVLPESLRNLCREMDAYSKSELNTYTMMFLFSGVCTNPTAWQRRRCVINVHGFNLEYEVEVLDSHAENLNSNNYLFWHQRRWVSEKIGSDAAANNELEFTAKILFENPDNVHAWLHRQWVREVFGKKNWGKAELDFCNEILEEDASNCFAWNQRYFVLRKHPNWQGTRSNEVKYAIDAIHAEPENEMPWMYLKCLVSGKNYEVLNESSTRVLSNVVEHIKEGRVDIRYDACVKKRVVNALKMVLSAVKRNDFKPNHDLKTSIDYLCPPEEAEKSFAEKVVSILRAMDVTCI